MDFFSTATFIASLFIIFLTIKMISSSKNRRKEKSREAPGPRNIPFLGGLHHLLGSKLPHRTLHELSAVHGPVMSIKLGEIRAVVISSAEGAREIMRTHDIAFATRPINKAIDAIFYGGNDILFGAYGDFWRQMRRICNLELLSSKRVRAFRAVREEEVSQIIRSIAAASGTVVDLSSKIAEVSNNITARTIIGGTCDDKKLFFSALNSAVEFVSGFTVVDLFPSFPFIGRITGFQRRLEECRKNLDKMAERIVEEHVEKMGKQWRNGEKEDEMLMASDITDVLLKIQREDSLQFPLSNDNIKAVVNDLLLAGSETTATLLEWTMSELIQNPNIMKKAQKEVREVIGGGNALAKLVDEELTGGKLPYLQLVIKEALRMHLPAPLLLPRENQESCEVMGYEIPAKTRVIINMWTITRDSKYWDDPDVFSPERFEDNLLDFKGSHFEFAPFGAGRRICPGMQFGLATIEIILAHLLYYFDWEYLGKKKLDMEEAFGVTARRNSPLCLVPTLHFPLLASA